MSPLHPNEFRRSSRQQLRGLENSGALLRVRGLMLGTALSSSLAVLMTAASSTGASAVVVTCSYTVTGDPITLVCNNAIVTTSASTSANGTSNASSYVSTTNATSVSLSGNGNVTGFGLNVTSPTGITVSNNGRIASTAANATNALTLQLTSIGTIAYSGGGSLTGLASGLSISGNATDVTVNGGGNITGSANGSGILIDTPGNVTVAQSANVSGGAGIRVNATGQISIKALQTVTGTVSDGISATTSGGPIVVNGSGVVSGAAAGISANATGAGNVTLNGSGNITGGTTGVTVVAAGGAIRIAESGNVTGGTAISATNTGAGAITIIAAQTVNGTTGAGVSATSVDGGITVNGAGLVTGATYGILANATGAGRVALGGSGDISGGTAGVSASSVSGNVIIGETGNVTGATGMLVAISGSGDARITTAQTVNGTSGDGVSISLAGGDAVVNGTGAIIGSVDGVSIDASGRGTITVNGSGAIAGGAKGVSVSSRGGAVVIAESGNISGGVGISASTGRNGTMSITVSSTVTGATGAGIDVSTANGSIAINGTGSVSGAAQGISATASGVGDITIDGSGNVSGASGVGIFASTDGGNVTIAQSGDISGAKGVKAMTTGSGVIDITVATNSNVSGSAADNGYAIWAVGANGSVTITNNGSLSTAGTNNADAIRVTTDAGSVTVVNNGLIGGNANPVAGQGMAITSTLGDIDVTNNGFIGTTESASSTAGAYLKTAGNITFTAGAGSQVLANLGRGINLNTSGDDSSILVTTDANSSISSARVGMTLRTLNGSLQVYNNGSVSSTSSLEDGVNARSLNGAITIVSNGNVTATGAGADGVSLSTVDGVIALSGAGDFSGAAHGVLARATGAGSVTVNGTGNVTGGTAAGISASSAGGDVTVAQGGAVSGATGISASTNATGNVSISTHANVTGQVAGLAATTESGQISIIVDPGVLATADGGVGVSATSVSGDVSVSTTGAGDFIRAANGTALLASTSGNVSILVANGSDVSGLSADSLGIHVAGGATSVSIVNNGLIQGGVSAIQIDAPATLTTIDNNSGAQLLSHASGLDSLVVDVRGGAARINNAGAMIGAVNLLGSDSAVVNAASGVWSVAGTSSFGSGSQRIDNAGTLQTYVTGTPNAGPVTATFSGLTQFNNTGLLSMQNQIVGDQVVMSGATFNGTGASRVALDVVIGGVGSTADVLSVANSTGSTALVLHDVNPGAVAAFNPNGVVLVRTTGSSSASDFSLQGGPITKGAFVYELVYRPASGAQVDNEFLLVSTPGKGLYGFAPLGAVAQRLSLEATRLWLNRQGDLRAQLMGLGPDSRAADTFGGRNYSMWASAIGTVGGRTQANVYATFGNAYVTDTSYRYANSGYVGGVDARVQGVAGSGAALLFGVYGGVLTSSMRMKATASSVSLEGGTVGAYASYIDRNFFVDATIRGDLLAQKFSSSQLGLTGDSVASSTVKSLGGMVDAGYRIQATPFTYVEAFTGLSYIATHIPAIGAMDIAMSFSHQENASTRSGVRFGWTGAVTDDYRIEIVSTSSIWNRLRGSNSVTMSNGGETLVIADAPQRVYGEVGLGLNFAGFKNGWAGFMKADYQFASGYRSLSGNVGLRYSW